MGKPHNVVNMCVIAHVDHGKTTLSDSLLSRAHVLASHKAGTALALDTDKEEQERGITIKSTGISLEYPRWQSSYATRLGVAEAVAASPVVAGSTTTTLGAPPAKDGSSALYIGNLPWTRGQDDVTTTGTTAADEATVVSALRSVFAPFGAVEDIALRGKRGFAIVTFATVDAADAALARHQDQQPLVVLGRPATVERQGDGPVLALAKLSIVRGWASPVYHDDAAGVVQVAVPGTEHCGAADRAGLSHKMGKRSAALACLDSISSDAPGMISARGAATGQEEWEDEGTNALRLNLIDCPGHVDFSGEVTAALRITDGAMVVVDCVEGVGVQTETVLRQALAERVKPVLFLNKMDRVLSELQLSPEEAYRRLRRSIDSVNEIIATYQPPDVDYTVSPEAGTVAFGSGLQGWGFTLKTFAALLLKRRGDGSGGSSSSSSSVNKMARRLWGEYYHDRTAGKWRNGRSTGDDGTELERSFCAYVLTPIYRVFAAQAAGRAEELDALATSLGLTFKQATWAELSLKDRRKALMRQWLPVADGMLTMIDDHLPRPHEAQTHRTDPLYEGSPDDAAALAMRTCDPAGPVMFFVSKLVPVPGSGQRGGGGGKGMVAFGRLFSGTLHAGQTLYTLGSDHAPGDSRVPPSCRVQAVLRMMATSTKHMAEARAGDIVGLTGVNAHILKTATLTSEPTADRLVQMHFSVSPVVRVAVAPIKPANLAKVQTAARRLAQLDPCMQCLVDPRTGESIIAGVGELHVEVCVRALQELAGCEVVAREPSVQYVEVATADGIVCLAKSGNKHNRLFVKAAPLGDAVVVDLVGERVSMAMEEVARTSVLTEVHGWDRAEARRVIAVAGSSGCIVVNGTVGLDLGPIQDMLLLAFQEVARAGPLCEEPLRGVKFTITDAKYHADTPHRRADQIVPMARRAFRVAFLAAGPSLREPVFAVEVQVPDFCLKPLRQVLRQRHGAITEDTLVMGTPLHVIKATLPVAR